MKKIIKLFIGLKIKFFGIRYQIIESSLAGVPLHIVKGTLSEQPDQDDAWLFYLVGRFDYIFDIGANIGQSALFAKVQGNEKRLLLATPIQKRWS